jgi:hypothetical protein
MRQPANSLQHSGLPHIADTDEKIHTRQWLYFKALEALEVVDLE